jgi:hypothetical protein
VPSSGACSSTYVIFFIFYVAGNNVFSLQLAQLRAVKGNWDSLMVKARSRVFASDEDDLPLLYLLLDYIPQYIDRGFNARDLVLITFPVGGLHVAQMMHNRGDDVITAVAICCRELLTLVKLGWLSRGVVVQLKRELGRMGVDRALRRGPPAQSQPQPPAHPQPEPPADPQPEHVPHVDPMPIAPSVLDTAVDMLVGGGQGQGHGQEREQEQELEQGQGQGQGQGEQKEEGLRGGQGQGEGHGEGGKPMLPDAAAIAEANEASTFAPDKCAICKMTLGQSWVTLRCTHTFHRVCIALWAQKSGRTCPCCRQPTGIPIAHWAAQVAYEKTLVPEELVNGLPVVDLCGDEDFDSFDNGLGPPSQFDLMSQYE